MIFFFIFLPGLWVLINLCYFLFTGKLLLQTFIAKVLEIVSMVLLPLLYLGTDFGQKNECCGDTAIFAPEHRLTIYVIIIFCLIAYFYSSYRKKIAPPVVELITNSLLVTGIILNIIIGIHTKEIFLALLGNMPIIFLGIFMLVKNQRLLVEYLKNTEVTPRNSIEKAAWKIVTLNPLAKIPILFILCLPVLTIISALLLLIGQKPDSMVKAFTDTYKHGFSQLDYMCNNVQCGDHFLCSVAAKGHKKFVKPTRLGIRNEQLILCNRQLLISNAFEELLQQKLPFIHRPIRKSYNKVGNTIHRYYTVFDHKWVCDVVYVIMKPAEWFFLLVLYTFDKNPENRIARQYISRLHKQQLEKQAL